MRFGVRRRTHVLVESFIRMTDLETFVQRAGRAARRVRDEDLSTGRDPVWVLPEDAWREFAQALLKRPTPELEAFYMSGWNGVGNE